MVNRLFYFFGVWKLILALLDFVVECLGDTDLRRYDGLFLRLWLVGKFDIGIKPDGF
jgi:hypothetical protein